MAVLLLVTTLASSLSGEKAVAANQMMEHMEDFIHHSGDSGHQQLDGALVGDNIRELSGNDSLGTWAALQLDEEVEEEE